MKEFKTPLQELAEREKISLMEAQERYINMSADDQDAFFKQEIGTYATALYEIARTMRDPEEGSFLRGVADLLETEASRAQGAVRAYIKLLGEVQRLRAQVQP